MEETEDTTAAMAQAMGFSSFGAQANSNKRRKFNPRADAVVASTSTSIPHHISEAKSGSNAIPLGVRSKNEDEITLEDDEAASLTDSRKYFPRNEPVDDELGPQYLDTSRPPDIAAVDPTGGAMSDTKIDATTGDYTGHIVGAKSSAASTSWGFVSQDSGRGGYQARESQGHEPGKKWWDDYYDPSSNINPWERLEHIKGLGPRGNWMSWEAAKR
ncbi:hypothetical protein F5Y00DRAFT_142094 [Daldinia vernicosa]|uniref:uncharacterized protein n=1 Tax=Daldinia vernicosa TaxID=114800 RepID=UPI002008D932|nr:uncharacterized protein F5Y00DRAFT_142094 [Daldinia vernicosa]KAI0846471.1 hypothetical protein F5Y00DRAFT_142094 [Daldinia vernicosa]